jgi:hypothetical protein
MPFTLSDGTATVDVSTLEKVNGDQQSYARLHVLGLDIDILQLFGRVGQTWKMDGELLSDFTVARNQIRTWFRAQSSITFFDDEFPSGTLVKILNYAFHLPRGILGFIRLSLVLQEVTS